MTSDARGTDRLHEQDATEPDSAAAGGEEEAAVPPPADFDPAEHPSNPDLVADDEDPAR